MENSENTEVVDSGDTGATETKQVNPGQIRKSTTTGILKAAENASGMSFGSVEEMMGALAQLSQLQSQMAELQQKTGTQTKTVEQTPDDGGRKRVSGNDLQEQILAMKQEMELKEQRLRERELEGGIRNAMGDRFDTDMLDYTMNKIKAQLTEVDGEWIVVNSKNQQRYTSDGRPMAVADLIEEIAKTNPKLLRQQPQMGGSGLRPGVTGGDFPSDSEFVPDYTTDPAAFAAWASKRGLGKGTGLKSVTATVYNSTNISKKF